MRILSTLIVLQACNALESVLQTEPSEAIFNSIGEPLLEPQSLQHHSVSFLIEEQDRDLQISDQCLSDTETLLGNPTMAAAAQSLADAMPPIDCSKDGSDGVVCNVNFPDSNEEYYKVACEQVGGVPIDVKSTIIYCHLTLNGTEVTGTYNVDGRTECAAPTCTFLEAEDMYDHYGDTLISLVKKSDPNADCFEVNNASSFGSGLLSMLLAGSVALLFSFL